MKMTEIQDLAIKHLENDKTYMITSTQIKVCQESPFSLYCELFADKANMDKRDLFIDELVKAGIDHEKDVIDQQYKDIQMINIKDYKESFRQTLAYMSQGCESIASAPLFHGHYRGIVDILEKRTDGKSIFGDYYYVVKEIKLSKHITVGHILQAMLYTKMLGKIQERTPGSVFIISGEKDENDVFVTNEYMFEKYEDKLEDIISLVCSIIDGKITPDAVFGTGMYPWRNHTNNTAISKNDISLVSGIGMAKREKLNNINLNTVDELASVDPETLIGVKGIGAKTADDYINSAKALTIQSYIIKDKPEFKDGNVDIFVDFEGLIEPINKEMDDYLIGVLVRNRETNIEKYYSFIAEDKNEKKMFEDFITFIKKQPEDAAIYHWHTYEQTHIKKLSAKHGIDCGFLLDRLVDLAKISGKCVAFPTHTNNLKDIATYLKFSWTHDLDKIDAVTSMLAYNKYIADKNEDDFQLVIDYNKDDCIATRLVKDWFEKNVI